tara:strand:- start:15890 stop:16783 length:894 start_codon:yes stop_codon:yes gene_type:complete
MISDKLKLTVLVPAYQEELGIESVLNELIDLKNKNSFIDEIIVIDDGSTDKTVNIVSNLSEIRLIQHSSNLGYGASLKTGILNANNNIIAITDADKTYPNSKIIDLYNNLINEDLDMIVGARTGKNVKIPYIRRPAKWFIGKLANWVTGVSIPDINSGLRIFKKKSFSPFKRIVPDGFSFTTTITLGMLSAGYKVKFNPIDYYARAGKSKIKPISDTINFIKLIMRIGLYFSPLKIFMPISLFLLFLSILIAFFTMFFMGKLADISVLIIAMTGFQFFALALLSELINHRMPNQYSK